MNLGITVHILKTRVHGLEVFKVLVGGAEHSQAFSLQAALSDVLKLKNKLEV